MKIIRKGVLPKDRLYGGTCANCGCEVEAAENEVIKQDQGDRYSGEVMGYFVLCPTQGCARRITLSKIISPDDITRKLRKLAGWKRTDPWLPSV